MAFALRRSYGNTAPTGRRAGPGRGRVAAGRGASALGSLLLAIAGLIRLVTGVVVLLIVAAIILRIVGANGSNTIVKDVHDAAAWLVTPFKNLFSIHNAKVAIAVNWGIAAIVYAVVGGLIARLIARMAPSRIAL